MGNKMLIDATHAEETRVVVARGNRIEEFDFESASRKPLKGNIYLAKVTRVEPSLQAAFVEYGGNRHGFLAFTEIHPDYYQIPIADRLALLKEQEEDEALEDDDDESPDDAGAQDEAEAEGEAGDEVSDEDGTPAAQTVPLEAQPLPSISELADASVAAATMDVAEVAEGEAVAAPEAESSQVEPVPAPDAAEIESVEEDAEARTVDSVGAEDALEEVPQRRQRRQPRRRYKIQEVIKRRQILLVQVVKEERGNKGAALTTYLSLAGRYCVLMPNTARGGGISRKITDASDRRRLKEVAKDIEVPQGMGLIVRTAGAQRTRPEIKRDFDYLIRLWESVRDLTLQSQAPSLVYEEGSLIKRSIRDLYTKDVDEVVVEGEEAYREAKDFMKMLMPSHAKNVKLYREPKPLFQRYQVENHLDALFSPTVTLPSGGYIVINQTEALVAIDINSGRATREHSIEDTAVKTNLEACDEIGRQLRLRDLAGLIVIDFIDMEENRNNRAVERRIKDALKNDRARIQVGRISHFGLLEMSRQRLRPGFTEGTFRTCPHCEGRGIVRSISSCGLGVLRSIDDYLQNKRAENITVKCAREVVYYLLNEKRDSLLALEQNYNVTIFVVPGGEDMRGTQSVIERATDREHTPRRVVAVAPVQIDSALGESDQTTDVEDLTEDFQDEASETVVADSTDDGERKHNGRRRRRRGRRGGQGRGDERRNEAVRSDDTSPTSEVSSVGEESGVAELEAERQDVPDQTGDGEEGQQPATDENSGGQDEERRGRREGRGRGRGRGRGKFGRGRDRRDGDDAGPQRERAPRDHSADSEVTAAGAPVVERVTTVPNVTIPEIAPSPEPRKWQPPAATVGTVPAARKAGWWSKRKSE